jgi:hypothetical protein
LAPQVVAQLDRQIGRLGKPDAAPCTFWKYIPEKELANLKAKLTAHYAFIAPAYTRSSKRERQSLTSSRGSQEFLESKMSYMKLDGEGEIGQFSPSQTTTLVRRN